MIRLTAAALLLSFAFLPVASADGPPEGWHKSMKEGLEAAKKSSKPLLVITAWSRKL